MGNPLESEVAAFRWLVVVLLAAASVALVAKVVSTMAAIVWSIVLVAAVSVVIVKGVAHMLSAPEEEEDLGVLAERDGASADDTESSGDTDSQGSPGDGEGDATGR